MMVRLLAYYSNQIFAILVHKQCQYLFSILEKIKISINVKTDFEQIEEIHSYE